MSEEPNSRVQTKNTEDFPLNNVRLNSTVLHCADNAVDNTTTEHCKEDSVRTPDKEQQWVPEGETTVHDGLENPAHDDLITLTLEEIKVDSEGKLLPNGQMVRNNLVEVGTLQQQESAFSPNTPYTREFDGAINNKCMLYENSSICLPLEELNPANIASPVPKIQNPDPRDSLHAQGADSRTNLSNREHGLNSDLQLSKKLSPVKGIIQQSLDLKDANKIVGNSQVVNSTANKSFQPSHKDQKKGFVGSWVTKLLSKNTSFVSSSASSLKNQRSCKSPSIQKISEVQLPVKGASNFGGFQSRGTAKTTETSKSVVPQSGNTPPLPNFKGFPQSTRLPTASHTSFSGLTWNKSGITPGTLGKVTQSHSPGRNSVKAEESDSDKTKKLRLKLLKKLNAKRKKLASLDRLAVEQMKHEKPVSGDVSVPSQTASHNDSELLQSLLSELQNQIDAADSESGCTSHSNSDEILAELLSPTSTVASLEAPKSEEECMYMEMVDSSVPVAVSDEQSSVSHTAVTSEDHNYYSPVKNNHLELLTVSKPNVKKLDFESPIREDIFEDLFSISAPSSMAGDIDLPHFDETLFETW